MQNHWILSFFELLRQQHQLVLLLPGAPAFFFFGGGGRYADMTSLSCDTPKKKYIPSGATPDCCYYHLTSIILLYCPLFPRFWSCGWATSSHGAMWRSPQGPASSTGMPTPPLPLPSALPSGKACLRGTPEAGTSLPMMRDGEFKRRVLPWKCLLFIFNIYSPTL